MTSVEIKLNEALDTINFCERQITSLRGALHQERVAHAATRRAWTLKESGLPQSSIDRLHVAFAKSTDNAGLREAINVEKKRGSK